MTEGFDTIAAISTAVGNSGISVIRISGSDAFLVAEQIFKGKVSFSSYESHTVHYGRIIDPDLDIVIDEVLILKMSAPKTYTREDVVEIDCHGGYVTASKILDLLYRRGIRPAQAGEFTKRAFLNGRIDLAQAEAVMDLIGSRTEKSSKIALSQLEGNLSVQVNRLRQSLVDILAEIEVNFDYPEYDFEQITAQNCSIRLNEIKKELVKLISSFSFGKILREGMEVAIIGKPNAGKSSLLNRLARKNRAIVTEIPGTTRDILEEYVNILGLPIKLIDTAGLRQTEDRVEKVGVEKAWEVIDSSDLILFILDAHSGFEKEDKDIYEKVLNYHDKTLYVVNKTDITNPGKIHEIKAKIPDFLEISVLEDSGINALESEIYHFVNKTKMDTDNQVLVTNSRHKMLLTDAEKGIKTALSAIDANMTLDIISMDIKSAADSLGQITGHHVSEEIVLNIFQRFCVGK